MGFAELHSSHAEFRDSGTKREKRAKPSANALRSPSPVKQGKVGDEAKPQRTARADEGEAFSDLAHLVQFYK